LAATGSVQTDTAQQQLRLQEQNDEDEGSGGGADDILDEIYEIDEPGNNILDDYIGVDEFEDIILAEGIVNPE
jgi:hypothetical protein